MIIFNLLLDILINNMTIFHTYFFLINIFKIPLRYFSLLIVSAIFIDLFLTHTYFLNLIWLLIFYFIFRQKGKHKSLFKNIVINSGAYVFYILSLYLYFNYRDINIFYLSKYLLFNYPVYLIYILISYKISFSS